MGTHLVGLKIFLAFSYHTNAWGRVTYGPKAEHNHL